MTETKVRIAGPSDTMNPSSHGFVIYAEWPCKDDNGQLVTMTQALDYAETQVAAVDMRQRWTEALN